MSKPFDKLLKFLSLAEAGTPNIAGELDEDVQDKIAKNVIKGYEIDEVSKQNWLDTNMEAVEMIKHAEQGATDKDFPFPGSAKVVFPLLATAVVQNAARLAQNIVQNDVVYNFGVIGPDPQGQKQMKVDALTAYASYFFLKESKAWLSDTHKICTVLSGWGVAFRQVYYDPISKVPCHEFVRPEDVVINQNITCLSEAKRITVKCYLTSNDVIEFTRSKQFSDIPLEFLDSNGSSPEDDPQKQDPNELDKGYLFLKQLCYIDLDDDGYKEPYYAYVLRGGAKLYGLYPAFKLKDIEVNKKTGEIKRIKPRIDLVDYHCFNDPEGGFWSIGFNYFLLHPNKILTALARQVLDSGTLANTQGGFMTTALQTAERTEEFEMGQFKILDCDPAINPSQHIIPLPFKEPSQVLFAFLQFMSQESKSLAMLSDVLTGDIEGQNTPATTALAMIEQATRAIKMTVQKLRMSLAEEGIRWMEINYDYLDVSEDGQKYASFRGLPIAIAKEDFNLQNYEIIPVADPTMSSEATKYAKVRFITELLQNQFVVPALNMQAVLTKILSDIGFDNAQQLVNQPQPQQPNPEIQLKAQKQQHDMQMDQAHFQLDQAKQENEALKTQIKKIEVMLKARLEGAKQKMLEGQAMASIADARQKNHIAASQLVHDAHKHVVETNLTAAKIASEHSAKHRQIDVMEKQPRNNGSSPRD